MNGKYILKSGTDFRNFSVVTLDFNAASNTESSTSDDAGAGDKPATSAASSGLRVEISSVDVTKEFEPDPELSSLLEKYKGTDCTVLYLVIRCDNSPFWL